MWALWSVPPSLCSGALFFLIETLLLGTFPWVLFHLIPTPSQEVGGDLPRGILVTSGDVWLEPGLPSPHPAAHVPSLLRDPAPGAGGHAVPWGSAGLAQSPPWPCGLSGPDLCCSLFSGSCRFGWFASKSHQDVIHVIATLLLFGFCHLSSSDVQRLLWLVICNDLQDTHKKISK